jgi:hypothetical protein
VTVRLPETEPPDDWEPPGTYEMGDTNLYVLGQMLDR